MHQLYRALGKRISNNVVFQVFKVAPEFETGDSMTHFAFERKLASELIP